MPMTEARYPSWIATLGSMREARRAGSHAASRPVTVRTTAAADEGYEDPKG